MQENLLSIISALFTLAESFRYVFIDFKDFTPFPSIASQLNTSVLNSVS